MSTQNQPLRCGILIIGSLFWHTDDNGYRQNWRANRLDLPAKRFVRVPIRYGRKSQTWGNAFTMIFDANAIGGQGLLVPCKAQVSSFDQLVEEVQCLWAAEANQATADIFHKNWGCVAAQFGPRATTIGIHEEWKAYFEAAAPKLPPAVGSDGKLNVCWPRTLQGEAVGDFDIILGTATMPLPADERPSAKEIAENWSRQDNGNERYFFENVLHGIRTQDDREIWMALNEQGPPWLASEAHKSAMAILKSEFA